MLKKIKDRIKKIPVLSKCFYILWKIKKALLKSIQKRQQRISGGRQYNREFSRLLRTIYKIKIFHPKTQFLVMTHDDTNLGDHAISIAETELLKKFGVPFYEIPFKVICEIAQKEKLSIFNGASVLIQGGGFLGSIWPDCEDLVLRIVKSNPKSQITVLPQTLYYDETNEGKILLSDALNIYNNHRKLTICTREAVSFNLFKNERVETLLIPDMALSLPSFSCDETRKGCLLILRTDIEKTMTQDFFDILLNQAETLFDADVQISDMYTSVPVGEKERATEVEKKLREFCSAELVITDRLHGMLFAAITGTPCIVIESKSYKIRGCYEWIKDLGYVRLYGDPRSIPAIWEEIGNKKYMYNNTALLPYFKKMIEIIRGE